MMPIADTVDSPGRQHNDQLQTGQSGQAGQSGQTGMSKHYSRVKKAKMTSSSNQQQSKNVGENIQLMIDANMMSGGKIEYPCL